MKSPICTLLLSLSLSALGAALPATPKEALVKRASPGLTAWEQPDFTGRSKHYTTPDVQWNKCRKSPSPCAY